MVIYRAKEGDTIASIARRHGILPTRLCELNGTEPDTPPVPGQAFFIDAPAEVYHVKEGDTLRTIAARRHISPARLRQMNPALLGGDEIYPGMTLTITPGECPRGTLSVLGYAAADTAKEELLPLLPHLTYLAITGARTDGNGRLHPAKDAAAVAAAREGGVVPLLHVTMTAAGGDEERRQTKLLLSEGAHYTTLADEVLSHLNARGYGGVLLDLPFLAPGMGDSYNALVMRLRRRLGHGRAVLSTVSPLALSAGGRELGTLGRAAGALVLSAYDFATRFSSPAPEAPYDRVAELLSATRGLMRPQKLFLGLSTRAEDFPVGGGVGEVLPSRDIPMLAREHSGRIGYDPVGRVPYLSYRRDGDARIAFFEDAESFLEKLSLAAEAGIGGVALFPVVAAARPLLSILSLLFSVVRPYGG